MPRLYAFPSLLTADQREQLLASCDRTTLMGSRDYAVLALMIDGALRMREVLQLTCIDAERSALLIPATKTHVRLLPLTLRTVEALQQYMALQPQPVAPTAPLFLTADGQRLDVQGLATLVQAAAQRAGLPQQMPWAHHLRLSVLHDRLLQAKGAQA
jgi:site-specific recombinase XerD